MQEESRRIVVAGGAGWDNLGDDMLARTIVEELRLLPGRNRTSILGGPMVQTVFSDGSGHQLGRHGLLNSAAQAWDLFRATHLLIGGGGLMHDLTPHFYRPFVRSSDLAAHGTRLQGTYLVGVGGHAPTTNRMGKDLERLGRTTRFAWWRDEATRADLAALLGDDRGRVDLVAPDPLFGLMQLPIPPRASPFLVVNLRPWWHLRGRVELRPDRMEHLLDNVASALRRVSRRQGVRVVLASYCRIGPDSDRPILAKLHDKLDLGNVELVAPRTATEAIETMAGALACISMRLHPIVVATTQGVPTVALEYDRKISAACEWSGQADYCLPLDVDSERLEQAIAGAMTAEARARIAASAGHLRNHVTSAFEQLRAAIVDDQHR